MTRAEEIFQSLVLLLIFSASAGYTASRQPEQPRNVGGRQVALRGGKLFVDGEWLFLKIAKPLNNFAHEPAVNRLIADLDTLKAKGYNCFELNCYWHELDPTGDGVPDSDLAALRRLIDEITSRSMFACLSVETYGVGGGQIPKPFLDKHSDVLALNHKGKGGVDTEYGFMTAIPSIFHEEYRRTVHRYIREVAKRIDTRKILWFETTVEPQYMGDENLDYSVHARRAYEDWLREQNLEGPEWPASFPIPREFRKHPTWNRFRAEALAAWVNGDAEVYRKMAGPQAYVAVDYLETDGPEMPNRNGDSLTFLRHLTSPDIIQVNWHWNLKRKAPNTAAYRNVRRVMQETGRPWAITEHMTLNGADFLPKVVPALLENTLASGTRLGWEFCNVKAISKDPFTLYEDDWSPKPLMVPVDENWAHWQQRVREVEADDAARRKH